MPGVGDGIATVSLVVNLDKRELFLMTIVKHRDLKGISLQQFVA